MTWIAVIVLAATSLVLAALIAGLARSGWMLFASALLFGLAGYAFQASPDLQSAPKPPQTRVNDGGEALVAARRALFDPAQQLPSYLTVSDGFARQGRYGEAAQLLRGGLADNPADGEAWLALATALTEHAGGQVTPAALFAYEQAEQVLPLHPGPAYFLGTAYLRSNQPEEALETWRALLDRTPADAPWREDLLQRTARLEAMLAQMRGAAGA